MTKVREINVKDTTIRTMKVGVADYICITDIARQKNQLEPKDVVKNWMRSKNTIEYLGMWELLNNPNFKGGRIRPPFYGKPLEIDGVTNKTANITGI